MCTVYFDPIHPPAPPGSTPPPPPFPTESNVCCPWVWDHLLGLSDAVPLKRKELSLLSSHWLSIAPPLGVETPEAPPPDARECWLAWFYAGPVQATAAAVHSWLQRSCQIQMTHFTLLPAPSSALVPEPWGEGMWHKCPLYAEPSTSSYPLHFDQWWISELTMGHCTKMLLWRVSCTNLWAER